MPTGYSRVIYHGDLYPIEEDLSSSTLNDHAEQVWAGADKHQRRALFWSTLKASRAFLAYCIFPRICLIGFKYAQPFLLTRMSTLQTTQKTRFQRLGSYGGFWTRLSWPCCCK
ncbi:hypothetical protein M430DRAFT_215613 [Amorphotheca resinae ATCC 22711]|uniref:Uncharacterized protein n=1 Tax=Amorphotheca resinae ATCC 22711 TaxID=857342 RepID=A0A2T3B8X2_AMORE|nr:hypothetical protein M430DRAFT_215613 [Amorphotheca resinae ATCC 22711]PSS23282.1 hypothetical protein M430DRAFT_215613 [Amorphotheca resinae ATCC 22711]